MLTVLYPPALLLVRSFPLGLLPIHWSDREPSCLVIKATKEMLLTAKVRRGLRIYAFPVTRGHEIALGLVTAFFDDSDEPLAITTALCQDSLCNELVRILSNTTMNVHFFDEHNRELLGYAACISCPNKTRALLAHPARADLDEFAAIEVASELFHRFAVRTARDDEEAIAVTFEKPLWPENLVVQDLRPEAHDYHGGIPGTIETLERSVPGPPQERDIARLFRRLFGAEAQIFLNPLRVTHNKELVDLLVVTKNAALLVQAKDSPNVESTLQASIFRKKLKAQSTLEEALGQMRGALRYVRSTESLRIRTPEGEHELSLDQRNLRALVVVKELFIDEFASYSPPVLALAQCTNVPCIALDYPELATYAANLHGEEAFLAAYHKVFDNALRLGELPRLRFVPPDNPK